MFMYMKYKNEINSEWVRLIKNEGFTVKPLTGDDEGCSVEYEGKITGRIMSDGEVFIKPEHRELMNIVFELRGLAQEYVSAYQRNAADNALPNGYRKICDLGNEME